MASLRNVSPIAIVVSIIAVLYLFILYEGMVFPVLSNSDRQSGKNFRSGNKYSSTGQELVDLSEDGNIGTAVESIDVVHIKGLSHRGVWMIVLDNQLENVLFVRRSQTTVTCKNAWSLFGEHTQAGETYQQAALRGVREELELEETDFSLVADFSSIPELVKIVYSDLGRVDNQWTQTFFFVLKHQHIFLENREASGYLWVPIHASSHWITQCNTIRCRSCTDITSISVVKSGEETVYPSMGQVIAEKMDALLIKVAALAKHKETLLARNISLGRILPDDDALPHVMHHDDQVSNGRRLAADDQCTSLWRQDELVGRCFGLKSLSEYKAGKVNVPDAVATAQECKDICCKLGAGCVTWQVLFIYLFN
jgi:ADP-ribose pyrophosphatase YjhB (NUDIX family)